MNFVRHLDRPTLIASGFIVVILLAGTVYTVIMPAATMPRNAAILTCCNR